MLLQLLAPRTISLLNLLRREARYPPFNRVVQVRQPRSRLQLRRLPQQHHQRRRVLQFRRPRRRVRTRKVLAKDHPHPAQLVTKACLSRTLHDLQRSLKRIRSLLQRQKHRRKSYHPVRQSLRHHRSQVILSQTMSLISLALHCRAKDRRQLSRLGNQVRAPPPVEVLEVFRCQYLYLKRQRRPASLARPTRQLKAARQVRKAMTMLRTLGRPRARLHLMARIQSSLCQSLL